ncbi:MAG: CCA tRNA nucleotidyltransferase [Alphaproteobacteria bacterium]|nr:CCA tRNA nucleotidyltransferase [Alphaproteobacteria bacterium]
MDVPELRPPPLVRRVAQACADAGGRCLLVGGSVRDHLMGAPVKDWDLEVYGLQPEALERTLGTIARVDTVGRAFSVFKLHAHGLELDVSLPRRDSKVGPGHTGIEATGDPDMDPKEAARRRDLTINAIMVDLADGSVLDPWGGRQDLADGLLRAVDPTTFLEDPLRTLRVVQFTARFGFRAVPELAPLCREAALGELPEERVLGEWAKLLLRGRQPSAGLAFAREADLLRRVFPEHPHAPEVDAALDRAVALRDTLEPEGRQLALMTAVWLAGLTPQAAEATLDRLKLHRWFGFPARERGLAAAAHAGDPHATDAELRWLSTRAEVDLALRAHEALHATSTAAARRRAEILGVLTEAPPRLVEGRDVLAAGLRPGPRVGQVVAAAYAAQLDGTVDDRATALALVDQLVASPT